jgi:hypothetical protein
VTEKEQRDRALLEALHPGIFDPPVNHTDRPDFDGGARGDYLPSEPVRMRRPQVNREPGGWRTVEVEDGAEWIFGPLDEN